MSRRNERGSSLLVTTLALATAVVAMELTIVTATVAHDRARAQAAADAAALAGVVGGPDALADVAARNRARLVEVDWGDDGVQVRARVGQVEARARARAGDR